MNWSHTEFCNYFRSMFRYLKFAGLALSRPRYQLIREDCMFCMGTCKKCMEARPTEEGRYFSRSDSDHS